MSGPRHSAFRSPYTVHDADGVQVGTSPTLDADVYEWAAGGYIEDADGKVAYDDRDEQPDAEQVVQPESVPTAEAVVHRNVSSQAGVASFPGGVTL